MYFFNLLDSSKATAYQKFTFPLYESFLQSLEPQGSIVALGASRLGQPIGLALAQIQDNEIEAELLSLFVQAEYRNQGIATNLLNKIEQILAQRGCQKVTIVYMTGKPTTPVLEHLLQKYHWSKPESRMLVCKTDIRILNAPWIEMYEKLPSSFTIFPWCELTDRERATIQKQQEQENWIREDLIPFKYEQDMEALTSLGLRYQGQVVGWLISHRIAPDTIRYSCGWVKEDLQKTGCLLALIVKASKRQARAKIPNALWSVPVEFANKVRFDQFMRDYFSSVAETRGAFKTIC